MEAYRAIARAKHEAHSKREVAAVSEPVAPARSAAAASPRPMSIRDQVVCACTAANQRCLVCLGRSLPGIALPSLGKTGFASSLCEAAELLARLYAVAPIERAHELSARDKAVFGNARSLIYGEIDFFAFARVLEIALQSASVPAEKQPVFLDLGSGTGKAVVAAALVYPFAQCIGVELLPSLHAVAHAVVTAACATAAPALAAPARSRLEVVCGDMFLHERVLSNADVVYVATTGFDDQLLKKVAMFLEPALRLGAIVINLSLPLPLARFRVVHQAPFKFSWGNSEVYILEVC